MVLSNITSDWQPSLWLTLICLVAAIFLAQCLHRQFLHPLSRIPGPRLAACSSLWLAWHTFVGDECTAVFKLHERYGPVLRVGPNDVDIADGDAVDPIYLDRGGFQKTSAYSKFDIDGHTTIFRRRRSSSEPAGPRRSCRCSRLPRSGTRSMCWVELWTSLLPACGARRARGCQLMY